MARFSVNHSWLLTLGSCLGLWLCSSIARADTPSTSAVWPWLSLCLSSLLLAAIAFSFWLQSQIKRLQHRIRSQTMEREELSKRLEDVLAEDQFRTTFFHSSSHELRTPLNGIIGFLQLTSQGQYGSLQLPVRNQLGKCIMLAESLKHQINTILDLADGRRGQLHLHNTRVALPKLMTEIETIADGLRLRYQDCQFETKKLWPHEDSLFINDHAKILVILRHLVGNAFKFGKAQQRNHVTLAISKRSRALMIEVSDQGVGLHPEQISRIFQDPQSMMNPPQQARYAEHGLGLAMVRILIRLMDGEMKISSEPGVGSKFTVVIPEQKAVHAELPSAEYLPLTSPLSQEHSSQTTGNPGPSHNLMKLEGYAAHVLVVDDNEINCEIIQEILIPQGYRVSLAYGGREALARMRTDRPDLVLLDLTMPEFSGEHVMQEKQLDAALTDIPVILITARASDEDRIHGLDLGADDYLTKPIIQQELVLRVRNLLSRQRLTKRVALMEEREKLAQLGELITDLSREIKDIYSDRYTPEASRILCQQAIAMLPNVDRFGAGFARVFLQEIEAGDDFDLESLPLPKTDQQSLTILRNMRLQLAPSLLAATEKNLIWQAMQELSRQDLELFHSVTNLATGHTHLMEQSQKARLLMDGILEFHQRRGSQKICRIDQSLSKISSLLGPRLRMTGVRLQMNVPDLTLMVHSADLMQVGISLITTMCHRLEMLLDQDKWLDIQGLVQGDHLLLRLTCGGIKLTEHQALRLFDPVSEGNEANAPGSGLYVARRIVQRAAGRLDFNMEGPHTCFELELPLVLQSSSQETEFNDQ